MLGVTGKRGQDREQVQGARRLEVGGADSALSTLTDESHSHPPPDHTFSPGMPHPSSLPSKCRLRLKDGVQTSEGGLPPASHPDSLDLKQSLLVITALTRNTCVPLLNSSSQPAPVLGLSSGPLSPQIIAIITTTVLPSLKNASMYII